MNHLEVWFERWIDKYLEYVERGAFIRACALYFIVVYPVIMLFSSPFYILHYLGISFQL